MHSLLQGFHTKGFQAGHSLVSILAHHRSLPSQAMLQWHMLLPPPLVRAYRAPYKPGHRHKALLYRSCQDQLEDNHNIGVFCQQVL